MKLASLVASTVLAVSSFSASATTVNLGTLNDVGFHTLIGNSGEFAANAGIDDTWNFTLLTPSTTSFSALQTFAVLGGKISNFTATLSGTSFGAAQQYGPTQVLSWNGILGAGSYSVNIKGLTGSSGAAYSAQVSALAAPVPEPETYAMMLGGLALVGAMARRKYKKS